MGGGIQIHDLASLFTHGVFWVDRHKPFTAALLGKSRAQILPRFDTRYNRFCDHDPACYVTRSRRP